MNIADVVYRTEPEYAWREVTGPSELARLAIEFATNYAEHRTMRLVNSTAQQVGAELYGAPKSEDAAQERIWSSELIAKVISVLRAAGRGRERLSFGEVCHRARVSATRHVLYLLTDLTDRGLVHSTGKNRGRVYWAD